MSKAILVIDEMPNKCCDCPYSAERYCRLDMKKFPQGRKRKDCPLRPLPQRIPIDNDSQTLDCMAIGWNACINEITGETE